MFHRLRSLWAILLWSILCTGAQAQLGGSGSGAQSQLGGSPPPDPRAILAEAKAASGGRAWDALKTQHSKVRINSAGTVGQAERWSEITTGRSFINFTFGTIGGGGGYDGKLAWSQDASGDAKPETSDVARELSANAAYRDRLAFWYPERGSAQISYKERTTADGADFHVLRITPEGGRPFEFWVNTETKLIERLVEREAEATRTEIHMDVRDLQGVKVPYRVRASRGDPRTDELVIVDEMEFNGPLTGVSFAMPAPGKPDFKFPAGRVISEVPFELVDGRMFVRVMLNGKGPFRMLFDAGGANALMPRIATQLGVTSAEAAQGGALAQIDRTDLGGVVLEGQRFAVVDLAAVFLRVDGLADVAGIIGYEYFKRMPIRLDYERSQATLYDPAKFRYSGKGTRVPMQFRGTVPEIRGALDDIPGAFDIATGSPASLLVNAPFAEANGLAVKLGAKVETTAGDGAAARTKVLLAHAKTLKLGEVTVARPLTALALVATGTQSNREVAGIVGNGILREFHVTIDYPGAALWLEKNALHGKPLGTDRAGLWIERAEQGLAVVDVVAGGPASTAGIKVGDVIVAINGKPWDATTLAAVRAEMQAAPGTQLRLKLASGEERAVVLRELF